VSRSLNVAALAFSSVQMLPVIHGFWLEYMYEDQHGGDVIDALVDEAQVVYSSMPLDESRNIFQSCSVESALSDHFRNELSALVFVC
jgi:hypothetical protein